jgi:hypothetical protein
MISFSKFFYLNGSFKKLEFIFIIVYLFEFEY